VRHQVVVEGVELLQERAAPGVSFEEREQLPDRLLEPDHVDLRTGVADHGLEVLPHADVHFALVIAEPLVDEVFEELQLPVPDPNLIDP
jgi:hypothetical protein